MQPFIEGGQDLLKPFLSCSIKFKLILEFSILGYWKTNQQVLTRLEKNPLVISSMSSKV